MNIKRPYITIYRPIETNFNDVCHYCLHLPDKKLKSFTLRNRCQTGSDYIINIKNRFKDIPIFDISNVDKILTKDANYFKVKIR